MRVYTMTIADEGDATGLKPGTYVAHVSDDAVTFMFKPKGATTFRVGCPMSEEK